MTAPELIAALLAVTAGAAVQGALGFGAGLVSIPILLLIDPRFVPGPVVIVGLAMNLLAVGADVRHADWRGARWAVLGLVPGTIAATIALSAFTGASMTVASAAAVLAAVAVSAAGLQVPVGRRTMLGAGFFSGYLTGTAGIGGPPLALAYQGAPARTLRATLPAIFVAGGALTLLALARSHHLSSFDWRLGLLLAPGSVIGYHVTRRLTAELDGSSLRGAVLAVSAISALAAIARVLV